jgi:hypothetical protein
MVTWKCGKNRNRKEKINDGIKMNIWLMKFQPPELCSIFL